MVVRQGRQARRVDHRGPPMPLGTPLPTLESRPPQSPFGDTAQTSRGKTVSLHRALAGFTALALDGYGLRDLVLTRPTSPASYPVPVRRVATLLHASLQTPPRDDALALR